MHIIRLLYQWLSYLAWPFAQLYLRYRMRHGKEIESRLYERFGLSHEDRPKGKLIWFHVASLGEGLSALPLVTKIAGKRGHHVLVTYGTVTASEILPTRFPDNVQHCFLPFDLSHWVKNFLDHWQPDVGVFIESELWPALLMESKAAGVPLILLNGRMSQRSFGRWLYAKPFIKELLSVFSLGLMQDEAMSTRYKVLGLKNTKIFGNIKLAAEPLPVDEAFLHELSAQKLKRPFWVAASMHVYEEDFILEAHQKLRQKFPDLLTILVPRKMQHVEALYRKLSHKGISYVSHKAGGKLKHESVYVVDVMGEMGAVLALSGIVYVGGSQPKSDGKPLGGHNPLEPALLKNAICFGPDMSNTQKVADDLVAAGAAEIVETPDMLLECIADLIKDPKLCKARAKRAYDYAKSHKGLVDEALKVILSTEPQTVESSITPGFSLTRPRFWAYDSLTSKALYLPSLAYTYISRYYQSRKPVRNFDLPVICVGNLIVGGAGKTPTIIALAEYLKKKGYKPHIISRGYGRKRKDTLLVDRTRRVADVGDEPLLLAEICPTWVGDRYKAMKKAASAGATHLLLDDGFQDASIEKDFSLLVFDGHYGIGNGKVLPAGPLREPLAEGLKRVNATLLIGHDKTGLAQQIGEGLTGEFIPQTKLPKKKFVAFAGIGNPEKFFESLAKAGAEIVFKKPLPDHAVYTEKLIKELESKAKALSAELVTTEKDAVKLPVLSVPLHVFKVKLKVSDLSCLDDVNEDVIHAHG